MRLGYWPLSGEYEFLLCFAVATAWASLVLIGDRLIVVRSLAVMCAAALTFYARLLPASRRAIRPLPLVLRSPWMPLHVGMAALAYGAFVAAGVAGMIWLLRRWRQEEVGTAMEVAVRAGYPALTASMALGMVWAQEAWGRYWGWDIKETWTFITWLVYTLYMHLPRSRRRSGWGVVTVLVGLGAVWVTLFGTPRLAVYSLHAWPR